MSSTATSSLLSASASAVAAAASASAEAAASGEIHSLYGMIPAKGGNMAFAIIFGVLLLAHILLAIYYKQRWIGVAFLFGLVLELVGYAARAKAHDMPGDTDYFLLQIIALTIAPCFIMGGYYYLLAKMVVIYGARFSILPPIYYSYIFICCDIISLVLQGAGGGIAGVALNQNESTVYGTHIMIGGLAFQVFTMSLFLFFWLEYFFKIYFLSSTELQDDHTIENNEEKQTENSASQKKQFFIDTQYKDHLFNPRYVDVRKRSLFKYFPAVVLLGTICIYIRCIYRVIELAQGWQGFLITHEDYVFTLDGMMLLIAAALLVSPFYPGATFGRNNDVPVPKSLKFVKEDGSAASSDETQTEKVKLSVASTQANV